MTSALVFALAQRAARGAPQLVDVLALGLRLDRLHHTCELREDARTRGRGRHHNPRDEHGVY